MATRTGCLDGSGHREIKRSVSTSLLFSFHTPEETELVACHQVPFRRAVARGGSDDSSRLRRSAAWRSTIVLPASRRSLSEASRVCVLIRTSCCGCVATSCCPRCAPAVLCSEYCATARARLQTSLPSSAQTMSSSRLHCAHYEHSAGYIPRERR